MIGQDWYAADDLAPGREKRIRRKAIYQKSYIIFEKNKIPGNIQNIK